MSTRGTRGRGTRGRGTRAGPRKEIEYYGSAAKAGQRTPIKVKRLIAAEEKEMENIIPFKRVMDIDNDPALPYRRRKFEKKNPMHWGQIKLFTNEIEFITKYGGSASVIVYAGSSDGRHIPYLAHLFPEHQFHLWDPANMYHGYKEMENIHFNRELFTDEIAARVRDEHPDGLLFISDIRSFPPGIDYSEMNHEQDVKIEENVRRDMQLQRDWVQIMKPKASMLKFRLPYEPGETEYLDGILCYQAFAPETSSEARLIVTDPESLRTYDHSRYENVLYRFNRCTREQPVPDDDPFKEYIDSCAELFEEVAISYDVWALVSAVQNYIDVYDSERNPPLQPAEIIFYLINYIGSSFQNAYDRKKKLDAEHMEQNLQKL